MLSLFKGFRPVSVLSCAVAVFGSCYFIKLSPIIGSSWSAFSLLSSLMPLTGAIGLVTGALVAAVHGVLTVGSFSSPLIALVYHLPGVCASVSWAYPHKLMKVALPLLCMFAFILHPIGWHAAPYALYWFIPIVLYYIDKKTVFFQALSATFIAHAVGSVVWLYCKALPADVWLSLIPVVIFERLLNAALMTAVYYVVTEGAVVITQSRMFEKLSYTKNGPFITKNK